ncbi:hypothetical protein [Streptacidiphilus sp. EB129]|uniref:hypothetical protein n=1 Tax=Streptacidiphilus sp. EB129 TaxID=3156262 RepID=UPI003519020A
MTAQPEAGEEEPELPSPPRRTGAGRLRRRRRGPSVRARVVTALVACAVAVGLGAAAWSVPAARTVLLQSFTQEPSPYAELYFTSPPGFDGSTVVVPVALDDHGTGVQSYRVQVDLESATGKFLATTTVRVTPRTGVPVPVVVRTVAPVGTAVILVQLPGHPQTLHFRLVN